MELIEINPYVRYAALHHTYESHSTAHCCYDARLVLPVKGSGNVIINGTNYEFRRGSAIYMPPASSYTFYFGSNESVLIYIINFDFVTKYSNIETPLLACNESDFNPELVLSYEIPTKFKKEIIWEGCPLIDTIEHIVDYKFHASVCSNELSSAELKFFLINMLIRTGKKNMPRKENNVNDIISYIHTHYSDSTISCSAIASMFGYHPNYLTRIFKQVTDKSLKQYILYYRIKIAKDLLVTSKYDVGEIAWRVGFNSTSHFIASFRIETGLTPRDYRTKNSPIGSDAEI